MRGAALAPQDAEAGVKAQPADDDAPLAALFAGGLGGRGRRGGNDMILEDVLQLVNEVSTEKKRVILIFDEFQEIKEIEKGLDKKLR
ncbi:MAG: hypothetical protein IKH84_03420, partial [Ottowia sp.]|nr:hypothetical protein [Ottowia sp.]